MSRAARSVLHLRLEPCQRWIVRAEEPLRIACEASLLTGADVLHGLRSCPRRPREGARARVGSLIRAHLALCSCFSFSAVSLFFPLALLAIRMQLSVPGLRAWEVV